MAITNIVVFDDTNGIHVIGVEEAEAAISLMSEHAEANGLPEPGPRAHCDLRYRACVNVRVDEHRVGFQLVPDTAEGARRLFTWDGDDCEMDEDEREDD